MDSQNANFRRLYLKLLSISLKQLDDDLVRNLIKELNSLDYNYKLNFLTKWTCTDLILHLLNILREISQQEEDVSAFCQLIVNVAAKQEIVICSMSVNVILHGLKKLWFQTMSLVSKNQNMELIDNVLESISAITYGNGAYILPELIEWIIGFNSNDSNSIGNLIFSTYSSIDISRLCLQCLSGLCIMSETREMIADIYLVHCLKIFIRVLQATPYVIKVSNYKMIFSAQKGIQYILEGPSDVHMYEIGPLLAVLKKYLVFGLHVQVHDLPEVLEPLLIPDLKNEGQKHDDGQSQNRKKKKKKSRRKQIKLAEINATTAQLSLNDVGDTFQSDYKRDFTANNSEVSTTGKPIKKYKHYVTSSESEYSDTEGGQRNKMNSFALKIRQRSMKNLYETVKKTNKGVMFGYWNSFIPDTSSPNTISLLSCIVHDPAPKPRVAALLVICAMLDGSRTFLSLATRESDSTASFVPFCAMLAGSIHECHRTLLSSVSKDRSPIVLVHLLKTLSSLAANSPYHKLKPGTVSNMISTVRQVFHSVKDIDCRVAALSIFSCVLNNDPGLVEVACSITDTEFLPSTNMGRLCLTEMMNSSSATFKEKSWLIEDCISLCPSSCADEEVPVRLRIAALQCITSASKTYFVIVKNYIDDLCQLLGLSMQDEYSALRLHTFKLLEGIGSSLLKKQKTDPELFEKSLKLWSHLLSGPIQYVAKNEKDTVAHSHICDFFATIGSAVFEKLPSSLQLYCQTLFLGLTGNENFSVRSAAIRTLAVFIMFPFLRKDVGFMEDVAGCVLRLMDDQINTVQCNAAWSFGNLTDAIVVNVETDPLFRSQISNSLLLNLLKNAVKSFNNKEKVRFNMMRVLGNLLRFFDASYVAIPQFCEVMLEARNILVTAMLKDSLMKVRWNACIACGNYLHNTSLPIGEQLWTDNVYDALSTAMLSSKNYKVRIKAAVALCCTVNRQSFGSKFLEVFVGVIKALNICKQEETDLGEFKFKEQLQDQLITTLFHLTTFMELADLVVMINTPKLKAGIVSFPKSQLKRWHQIVSNCCLPTITQGQQEVYVALGQFNDQEKLSLFEKAVKHWGELNKECKIDVDSVTMNNDIEHIFEF